MGSETRGEWIGEKFGSSVYGKVYKGTLLAAGILYLFLLGKRYIIDSYLEDKYRVKYT